MHGKKSGGAPAAPAPAPEPPKLADDDIGGALRIDLADEGIRYLEKALALRARHSDAMVYLNLIYRQKSFAYFNDPANWQAAVDRANEWQKRGLEARNNSTPRL